MDPTTTRRMTRKRLLLLLPAVAGILAVFDVFPLAPSSFTESKLRRTLSTSEDEPSSEEKEKEKDRTGHTPPVMHTFFGKIDKGRSNTGMTEQSDRDEIKAWSSAWQAAGWDTKVLRVEDAEKHEDYERLYPLVDKLELSDYDKLCYVRWFAMAAVGGGYMSDYDVVPLDASYVDLGRPEKFQAGKFVVYASTRSGGAVPALLSGSRAEWTRMARALVAAADDPSVIGDRLPSDMLVLMMLQKKMDFEVRDDVERGQEVLYNGRDLTKEECAKIQGKRGVHFSHRAITDGFAEDNRQQMASRPEIIRNWMEMWKRVCMGSKIA